MHAMQPMIQSTMIKADFLLKYSGNRSLDIILECLGVYDVVLTSLLMIIGVQFPCTNVVCITVQGVIKANMHKIPV